jgi:hypothetical protein
MGRVQLGITLPDTEIAETVAFLSTLTGPSPDEFCGRACSSEDLQAGPLNSAPLFPAPSTVARSWSFL